MHLSLATRALAALAAGFALGDCVLFAASLLLWTAHLQQDLNATDADRARIWLRCVVQGVVLIALGTALAVHTTAVFLALWTDQNGQPWVSAAFVLLLAFAGKPAQPVVVHRTVVAVALIAALAPAMTGMLWAPCAFAIATAMLAIGSGGYNLGPMARQVATPGKWR